MSYVESKLVDTYINNFDEKIQHRLSSLRHAIQATFPKTIEDISYGIPTYRTQPKKRGIIHFGATKGHVAIYGVFDPKTNSTIHEKIKPHRTGKGTLQFKNDEPFPMTTIRQILAYHEGELLDKGLYK